MYINKLGPDYEDVIVMWEIVNEPDLDTYGRSHSDGAQMFANDTTWNNYSKPFIAWAKEKIDSYNTDILTSVGYIDAPMYDSFDANNTDVINLF